MAGSSRLRPADDLVAPAVAETVAALDGGAVDAAVVRLALKLAEALDDPDISSNDLDKLAAQLRLCLVELGATPKARGGSSEPKADGQLAQLRLARPS